MLPRVALGPIWLGRCAPPNELVVLAFDAIEIGRPLCRLITPLRFQPPMIQSRALLLLSSLRPRPNGRSYWKLTTRVCGWSRAESDLSSRRWLLLVKPGFCCPRKPATDEKSSSSFDQV